MDNVYKFIVEKINDGKIDKQTAIQTIKLLKQQENKSGDDIAIIGVSTKIPMADSIDEFWENISSGVDCVGGFPEARKTDITNYLKFIGYSDEDIKYCENAYLDDISSFDYKFFNISPKEASLMDPSQRLFLEVALSAIEDAGYGGKKLVGTNTSVYVGFASNLRDMYAKIIHDVDPSLMGVSMIGNLTAIIPSRVSYLLDLKGSSMVIDTACSSALVSVDLACNAIKGGLCEYALAGGININTVPLNSKDLKIGIESSDQRTRAFDHSSDGSGIGEGVAVILLKSLKKAIRDGDNIYAVIKGGAVNQDGSSAGITAPNPAAQAEVISKAWKNAGIDPRTITYMETHGTGTNLGDPIEIKGIQDAFKNNCDMKQFCAVSSVKTNIGHLCEAAGIVSLIKAMLSLKNKQIPPSIYFDRPNSVINFKESPVYVNTILRKWETEGMPRRCGVSAFGISGTNCHVVLEEAPEQKLDNNCHQELNIFLLSAKSVESLKDLIKKYSDSLNKTPKYRLEDICYTANTGRGHYNHRIAIISRNISELTDRLNNIKNYGLNEDWCFYGEHKVISDNREAKMSGDIREKEKKKFTLDIETSIQEFVSLGRNSEIKLIEICKLYISGADADWEQLYDGFQFQKVSLPVYAFERNKCWITIPEINNEDDIDIDSVDSFFNFKWIQEVGLHKAKAGNKGAILLFKAEEISNCVSGICSLLEKKNSDEDIIEIQIGSRFERINPNLFTISDSVEDYEKLFLELKDKVISQIIHLITINNRGEVETLEQLKESQRSGFYSLFYLTKALFKNKVKNDIDLVLISDYVNKVTGNEVKLKPENSSLFAIGKIIRKEHTNLKCRCIDIDENTSADIILHELQSESDLYQVAFRNGVRHIEEFGEVSIDNVKDTPIEIKENGVYLITGGIGGIGFEISKYLASKVKVKLALVGRTVLPDHDCWDEFLLENSKDFKTCKKIMDIKKLEALGSEVIYYSKDVSRDEISEVIIDLKHRFGGINGIIHGAGIGGAELIVNRNEKDLEPIISPKIQGTWLLDRLTRDEELDFFVIFSSIATIFSASGQAGYVAANSYQDSFGDYRNLKGRKTLVINWSTWKEAGMSLEHNVNFDTLFKAMITADAIDGFHIALNKDVQRVLIGKINYEGMMIQGLSRYAFPLSKKIRKKLDKIVDKSKIKIKSKNEKSVKDVVLTGKDSGQYMEAERVIARICKEELGFNEIDINDNFFELGADSILMIRIHGKIEQLYPGIVAITDIFEYSNIAKLAQYIIEKSGGEITETKKIQIKVRNNIKDVAIIGVSAKLPHAKNVEEFWSNIINGLDCIGKIPSERYEDINNYLNYTKSTNDNLNYSQCAYLDRIDEFDYSFFKISPKEASLMDPNQRLFLQTVWQAIEDAGYGGTRLLGSNTGVYMGFASNLKDMYSKMIYEVNPSLMGAAMVGNLNAIAPSRISYILDLKGPSMVVDTACSSSLVAVDLAYSAIVSGKCDFAIAGGIKINTIPVDLDYLKIGIESSDGRTWAFDDSSDGAGIGEGIGAILMKPLDKAIEDGDNIYCVIKSSAVNQDGNSIGITAPNPVSQTDVIVKAWEEAAIDPETIAYIETHGTGTKLGDPIEVKAINDAFSKFTQRKQFCAIGSVKSNIGHLYEAAGIINLIKAVLALKNKTLPPTNYFNRPNRVINFGESAIYVNTRAREWKTNNEPRRCGVSSFGMSGTNCHVILEEAPSEKITRCDLVAEYIFTLSAKSLESFKNLIMQYKDMTIEDFSGSLRDMCYTVNCCRGHYNYRLAIICRSLDELLDKLKMIDDNYSDSKDVYFGYYKISAGSSNKGQEKYITEEQLRELNIKAKYRVEEFLETGMLDKDLISEICVLYASGADINWEDIYKKDKTRKVKLPIYPFQKHRCWIDVPVRKMDADISNKEDQYFKMCWIPEDHKLNLRAEELGTILVLKDEIGAWDEISSNVKKKNKVIEVSLGREYRKIDEESYVINGEIQDYERLLSDTKSSNISEIIHMFTMNDSKNIIKLSELEESQNRGVYSLFYLTKAIVNNGLDKKINLLLVSKFVNEVTGLEVKISAEYAPLFGLGKTIMQEYTNVKCKAIDLDEITPYSVILSELYSNNESYQVAFRHGKRYVEEFREIDDDISKEQTNNIIIRENGVYFITGGTGGLGIETAKYLASKAKVKIILLSRSSVPDPSSWDEYLENKDNKRINKAIKDIRAIEETGSKVFCYSADVSVIEEIQPIVEMVREKHGQLRGVFHCAGIPGDGFLMKKSQEKFDLVLNPKIKGTWILDKVTEADNLDFFIMYSSGLALLSEPGQGDYTAANSYLGAFAAYRSKIGKKTLAIDWVSWKEAGMSVDYGFNKDAIFKAIPTKQAINGLEQVINWSGNRLLIGELAYSPQFIYVLEKLPFKLSKRIKGKAEEVKLITKNKPLDIMERQVGQVQLKGKDYGEYTEVERKVAEVYNIVLGFKEIDVNDSFFELGGDSVMLNKMHALLDKEFQGKLKLVDFFTYTSVASLAQFISCSEENEDVEDKIAATDEELEAFTNMFDEIEKGNLSVQDAMKNLE